MDTFKGTFKSTLLCPDCQTVKTTFEPFLTVQLPIPTLTNRVIFYKRGVLEPFLKFEVSLQDGATLANLKWRIAETITRHSKAPVHPLELMLVSVEHMKIGRLYEAN